MRAFGDWRGLTITGSLCALILALGCGGDDGVMGPSGPSTGGPGNDGGARRCIDEDDDGAGEYCRVTDCDDDDPEITNECIFCREPNLGCDCDPGTPPEFCQPPDMQVDGGILQCSEGTRYCREANDGEMKWSDCEIIGEYTFVPDP